MSTTTVSPLSCEFLEFPPEIHDGLLYHLELSDVLNLKATCRKLRGLIQDNEIFWQRAANYCHLSLKAGPESSFSKLKKDIGYLWTWMALESQKKVSDLPNVSFKIARLYSKFSALLLLEEKTTTTDPTLKSFKLTIAKGEGKSLLKHATTCWLNTNPARFNSINLSRQTLESNYIPKTIATRFNVKELRLSECGLRQLNNSIYELPHLTTLILDENHISEISEKISQLTSLVFLSLKSNLLTTLPSKLGEITTLKTLIVSYNTITVLPLSLVRTTKIEDFQCSNTGIKAAHIPRLLTKLDLSHNQEDNALNSLALSQLNLRQLNASGNKLTEIAKSFFDLSLLTHLDLNLCQLSCIPEEVSRLVNLEIFSAKQNKLQTLPQELNHLTKLTTLSFSQNSITELPVLDKLTHLQQLILSANRLTDIPSYFSDLRSLTLISLSANNFTAPPQSLANRVNLVIFFAFNPLLQSAEECSDSIHTQVVFEDHIHL